jgi:phosphatidylinositol alpha-mannosyltransferase
MRIALVSPYSWTYPGGVTRHIEALARHYQDEGHHVRVLTPSDPPDFASAAMHRGAAPQELVLPDFVVPLGRTVGIKANGAVSNLSLSPPGMVALHRELRDGGYDVAHIHEPVAFLTGWVAANFASLPLVGTFHSFSENRLTNGVGNLLGARRTLNHLHVRIAVSEAAAWTGRRFFGGHYRVIPNGVHVDAEALARVVAADRAPSDRLRIVFVGQAVERKGLPLLLRAFEALREHVPCELTVIGPTYAELAPLMVDDRGVRVLGKVDDARKQAELEDADVLCAPSIGGESFGMVLTEAFAAGTPPATGTSCVMASTGCSCHVATPRRWRLRCATSGTSPSGVPKWRAPPRPTSSASPGRVSPPRCWRPTRTRSRSRSHPAPRSGSPSAPA